MSSIKPKPIPTQATIGIFAPSGVVDMERLQRAVAYFESLGHRVIVAPEVSNQWRYFAGTDEERLNSFHRMLADSTIDLMMIARGGYGWTRLLDKIDWGLVAASRKAIIGFSDFTAFSLAALTQSNLVTYAGPGAATDFGGINESEQTLADHIFMEANLWPVLRGESHTTDAFACEHHYPAQIIEGPIWGSNLSLLTHLVGTPYMPQITNGILFIEEIAEEPYAIERLCYQLYHAGILQQQRALILADFKDCNPDPSRNAYTMDDVVDTLRRLLTIPVLTGLPFGHVAKKLTIPYGAPATLRIRTNEFDLTF